MRRGRHCGARRAWAASCEGEGARPCYARGAAKGRGPKPAAGTYIAKIVLVVETVA